MMTAMEKWHSFFSVSAGASATLTGLIFVGLSINLKQILLFSQLPGRALGTLILLANILLVGSFTLIPDQSTMTLGLEIFILAIVIWGFNTRMDFVNLKEKNHKYRLQTIQNLVFNQLAIAPFIIGSIFLLYGDPKGLFWIVPGIVMSFVKAIVDAWVLLIEIHR